MLPQQLNRIWTLLRRICCAPTCRGEAAPQMQQAKYKHIVVRIQRYLYPLDPWPIVPLTLSSSNLDQIAPAYLAAAALIVVAMSVSLKSSSRFLLDRSLSDRLRCVIKFSGDLPVAAEPQVFGFNSAPQVPPFQRRSSKVVRRAHTNQIPELNASYEVKGCWLSSYRNSNAVVVLVPLRCQLLALDPQIRS